MLCYDDFGSRLGERFTAVARDAGTLTLQLVEAEKRTGDGRVTAGFTLLFRADAGAQAVPQQTFEVSHPELGSHPIFLVPVGSEAEAILYEAVFTRA